ncbi:MAG: rod shape-determining protein RodA [Marinilabiliaceae bacterium]|nr:rod shape-determining protein RodA [Marinilabiliaceae bacterium]
MAVVLYSLLLIVGWTNLYAANFDPEIPVFFDTDKEYFKQLVWIGLSVVLIWLISLTDSKFFVEFAYIIFGFSLFLLLFVLFFGKEVNGAKAWLEIGPVRLQPAEITKFAVSLSVARAMSRFGFSFTKRFHVGKLLLIILIPILLIFLQNDTGSALVYFVFVFVFYREGLNPVIMVIGFITAVVTILTLLFSTITIVIILGACLVLFLLANKHANTLIKSVIIALIVFASLYLIKQYFNSSLSYIKIAFFTIASVTVFLIYQGFKLRAKSLFLGVGVLWLALSFSLTADYFFNNILSDYQLTRVQVLFGIKEDPLGAGYNVNQSKIAIGSGGVIGKGFLQGTQTKGNFVPEQSTDFIFCTVGEEWGFIGTSVVVLLFVLLLLRLIVLSERQHSDFSRIYGYSVIFIIFFHFVINIGMTIGLAPVIGIPLPLFSYGGSSLWGFTLLLFTFLKLDTNRAELIR